MPLPAGTRYRYTQNGKVRLAFNRAGTVIEAKNMKTGATHTPGEFARDRKRKRHNTILSGGR